MIDDVNNPADRTLEGWKEIATFLMRDVRTVTRWEKSEGLPVRRHLHNARSSVYALPSELNAWLAARAPQPVIPQQVAWWRPQPAFGLACAILLLLISYRGSPAALAQAAQDRTASLTIRRIYEGTGIDWCNGLSSDGRYLSFPDWSTGNLKVIDLTNKQEREVTNDGSIRQPHGHFTECSIFSPDDKQIAYSWESDGAVPELRTLGVDGKNSRVLFRALEHSFIRPFDWSADGSHILALVPRKDSSPEMVAISTNDGSARVLKKFDFESPRAWDAQMQFSPDGRYIAYSFATAATSIKRDIYLIRADGTGDTTLVRHPADDYVLGWSSDGKRLLFASDRGGYYGAWTIAVEDGRPHGDAVLAKSDIGPIVPIRFVNGTLYYGRDQRLSDVYVATVNPETGDLQSPPAPAKNYLSGTDSGGCWSPDGNYLAYRVAPTAADWFAPPPLITILNLKTGEERRIRADVEALDANDPLHWSPDGKSLLVIGLQNTAYHGLYKVDMATGATTLVVKALPHQFLLHADWSSDGKSVFYTQGPGGLTTPIFRHDMATGKDVQLAIAKVPPGIAVVQVSPDGKWIGFIGFPLQAPGSDMVTTLNLLPTTGGEVKEIYRAPGRLSQPIWGPNGRFIIFSKSVQSGSGRDAKTKGEFWRMALDGTHLNKLDVSVDGTAYDLRPFRFSPDGRHIVFSQVEMKLEIWALENVFPIPVSR